jgi:hypothetical protein
MDTLRVGMAIASIIAVMAIFATILILSGRLVLMA